MTDATTYTGPKTKCPLTLAQFQANAEPLVVTINGVELVAEPKLFSTGSFGWYLSGKVTLKVPNGDTNAEGEPSMAAVQVQVGLNAICVGSKPDDGKKSK